MAEDALTPGMSLRAEPGCPGRCAQGRLLMLGRLARKAGRDHVGSQGKLGWVPHDSLLKHHTPPTPPSPPPVEYLEKKILHTNK